MKILVTAATEIEMRAFIDADGDLEHTSRLITGIGPVETALSLSCRIHTEKAIDQVLNFGIAGAYPENNTPIQAGLLDICLAEQEVFGDLGIQLAERVESFGTDLPVRDRFLLDQTLLTDAGKALVANGIPYKKGTFVTVNCCSGTLERGHWIGRQFQGLCENMEGAAVARVCERFALPCLEVRCVSNMVEDRNRKKWKLGQACTEAGRAAAAIVNAFCV
ncbi:MAG: futalosine hydrolase [Candidatus Electrothrix sp. AR4]|nr:futalosine hydrolase [Candidatus Electrothrix sp. AR4]